MRTLDSKWIATLDSLDDAAMARGVPQREIDRMITGLAVLRGLLSDEEVRLALARLARMDIEDLVSVEPPDEFCGLKICGSA